MPISRNDAERLHDLTKAVIPYMPKGVITDWEKFTLSYWSKSYNSKGALILSDAVLLQQKTAKRFTVGFLFRKGSFWIGVHYSSKHKRLCVNLLPCCTIYFVGKRGDLPS